MPITKEIIDAFLAGDKEAFKHIYEKTKQLVYTVVHRMTGNKHEAEDIMHDVYLRIYEKRSLYNINKSALPTWIYRMAVNFTLNSLKKKKKWHWDSVIEPASEDILETYVNQSELEQAKEVLEKINPDFRVCLVLREVEDKSYEEIAEILKLSPGTVRSRINRGRKQLKKYFNEINRR